MMKYICINDKCLVTATKDGKCPNCGGPLLGYKSKSQYRRLKVQLEKKKNNVDVI